MVKPKIALNWCASCGGCEESIIDLAEDILEVIEKADIVFWPVALDFKYRDLELIGDGEITATLINGAVRTDEQEEIASLLRKKSRLIIAHGSCAHLGGVVGLANFYPKQDILKRIYKEVSSVKNPESILPFSENFHERVKALNQVIKVDYYIPGCPPTPELIKDALFTVLQDKLPPEGTVFGDKRALCFTCSRIETRPDSLRIKEFKRLYEIILDPTTCFLNQGIICLGPATRGGCGERCIKANMPCRGCFGPIDNVTDQGAKLISAISSIMDSDTEIRLKKTVDSIPDPAGLFYRYSLASSILRGRKSHKITVEN